MSGIKTKNLPLRQSLNELIGHDNQDSTARITLQALARLIGHDIAQEIAATGGVGIFATANAGLSATDPGDYFAVAGSGDDYLILYRNDSGSAQEISRVASAQAIEPLLGWASLVTDFDAITRSGFYRGDSSTANKPEETAAPGLLHIERGGPRHQILINQGRNNPWMWVRTRDFSGWGDWRKIALEDEVTAARDQAIAAAFADPNLDSLRINAGKPFPLRQMTVDGDTTPEQTRWSDLILDAEVLGAEPGKLYGLRYYQNGAVLGGSTGYRWRIHERDATTLASEDDVLIENTAQPEPLIDRDGGVQIIRLTPMLRPGMEIRLTVNADNLPPEGTPIISNPGFPGWSWVIDPVRYVYRKMVPPAPVTDLEHMVAWQRVDDEISVAYRSHNTHYRVTFGPNGFNGLPNFKTLEQSDDGSSWNLIQQSATDWLCPLIVSAESNGDEGEQIYTGGNHGSDGSDGGSQTARNTAYIIAPGGSPVAGDGAGYASEVVVTIVNEVMGYNTITFPRYVLRETYKLVFRPGGVSVTCKRQALEDIAIKTDNGLQATTGPFLNTGTYMFYGGRDGRAVLDVNAAQNGESGFTADYPDAWAAVFLEPSMGQFVVWADREFGAGDGRYNPLRWFRLRTKLYQSIVGGGGAAQLAAGDSYEWRGGYGWSWPGDMTGFDSSFVHWRGGEPMTAYAIDNEEWWVV